MTVFKRCVSLLLCIIMLAGVLVSCDSSDNGVQSDTDAQEANTTVEIDVEDTEPDFDIIDGEIVPLMQINEETNQLEISYDNGISWTSVNVLTSAGNTDLGIKPLFKIDVTANSLLVSYDEGATWYPLVASSKGDKGDKGAQGDKGDKGDTGAQGEKGDKGDSGISPKLRINSDSNEWEVSYDNGTTWTSLGVKATGAQGEKGDKGDTGAQGEKGDKGDTGAQGDKGDKGDKGDDGVGIENSYVDEFNHLWIVLANGTKIDAGYVGPRYIVTFVDHDGTVLKKVTDVQCGQSVTAPDVPTREGYVYVGWDSDCERVTSDMTIRAQYVKTHTVKFLGKDDIVLKTITDVRDGTSVTAPDVPVIPNYVFDGWDQDFSCVKSDLVVRAKYVRTYTVTFLGKDDVVLKTVTGVREGSSVTAPEAPEIPDNTFKGWDTAFDNVQSDLTVRAKYVAGIESILTPELFQGSDIPEDRDYGGYSFNVLCDTTNVKYEFLAESDGELIKDAVINRQNYIEEYIGIDFTLIEVEGGYNNMDGYAAEIESASGAGTPYDLALAYNLIPPVVAAKGLSRDLAESENLNLYNTQKEYWGKEIKKEIMVGGRIFWMSDNSSWNNIRNMLCMYVNLEYFSRINDGYDKSDLYTMVKNGTWTIDNMLLLIQDSYDNTNPDGDVEVDDLDSFGLQAAESNAWLDNWLYAAGFRYTKLNSRGTYDWTLGDQTVIDFVDWWQDKLNDVNIDKQDGSQYKMFLEGRAMFALSTVGMTEQNPEIEYTVLPLPLYKSSVKNSYSTPFSNTYSSWLIPKATKREAFERSATVLELLAAEGNRRLAPVYFEIYLKRQTAANDEDMKKMFNIIRNCIVFDLGYLYGSSLTVENLGGDGYSEVFIALRRTWAGTNGYANITSVWAGIKNTATTKLNNLMVDILDY